MGAISYFPRKNSLDTKRKLLIAAEFVLAIFLFLMPGGPGRPALEDGPDPDDLANFHSNGWPVSNSWPFDLVLVEQVAGSSNDESDDGSDESPIIIVEEVTDDQPAMPDPVEDDAVTNEVQGHRRNHHHNHQDPTQDPHVGDETNQESGQDDASYAINQTNAASGNYTTLEDQPIQIQLWNNANGSSTVISNITQPLHGTVTYDSNNTLIYTPDPNYNGLDSFVVNSTDGSGSATQNVTIIIIATNDPPSAPNLTVTTAEDTPVILTLINGTSDVDGDVTSLVITVPPTHGIVSISPDNRTVTYKPSQDFQGTDSFSYTMADAFYNSSGTVDIIVTPVNDIPIIDGGALDTISTMEGTPVQIDILSYVFDSDGDILTISNFTQPSSGVVIMNGDGTVTYTPAPGFVGQDSFTFTVTDSNGGSVSGSLTITVLPADDIPPEEVENPANGTQSNNDIVIPVNNTPTTNDVIVVLSEDSSASIQLDATDPDGDTITFSIVSPPLHGTLVLIDSATGMVQYLPFANYFGPDSFTFQVSDGITESDIATVELIVTGINDVPIATSDSFALTEDSPLTGDFTLNDADVDGDSLSASLIPGGTTHGTLVVNPDGSFLYIPDENFNGVASFQYQISDGNGGIATGTVMITVTHVNDAPVAFDDLAETTRNHSVLINVLSNDIDSDNDMLSVDSAGTASHGSVKISEDGKAVIYEPNLGFSGEDHFSYTVTDGTSSASATVDVTVYKHHQDDDDDDNNHSGVNDDDHDDEDNDENDDRDGNDRHDDHDERDYDNDHDDDNHGAVGSHDHDNDDEKKERQNEDEERDDDHDDNSDRDHDDDDDNDSDCGEDDHDQDDEENDDDD